jgi:hypothetical protein
MLFVAWQRPSNGGISAPSGWHMMGNNPKGKAGVATLWRKDFTGRTVTIPDVGPADTAITILCEFA